MESKMAAVKNIEEYRQNMIPRAGNPRYNEAWALVEVSRRMASIIQFGDLEKKSDKDKVRESLRLNLRIWTLIQAAQSFGEDLLPDPIRQNILSLCAFIDKHTIKCLSEPTAENIVALIDINRNIASGLLGSPENVNESSDSTITTPDTKDEHQPMQVEV